MPNMAAGQNIELTGQSVEYEILENEVLGCRYITETGLKYFVRL